MYMRRRTVSEQVVEGLACLPCDRDLWLIMISIEQLVKALGHLAAAEDAYLVEFGDDARQA